MTVSQWIIYDHPKDYPDKFVVRRWDIEDGMTTPNSRCDLAGSLDDARLFIPPGMVRVPPLSGDDTVIAEVWI